MMGWVVTDYRDGLLKVRHSGQKRPTGTESSTVVQLEPRVMSSSQESSASNHNELLALLPEHSELKSTAPAQSDSRWRYVSVLCLTVMYVVVHISKLCSAGCLNIQELLVSNMPYGETR